MFFVCTHTFDLCKVFKKSVYRTNEQSNAFFLSFFSYSGELCMYQQTTAEKSQISNEPNLAAYPKGFC